MKYLRFLLILMSIPLAIFGLIVLHGFFVLLKSSEQEKIKSISFLRKPYLKVVCAVLGIKVHHSRQNHINSSPQLLVSNHVSFVDIFIVGCEFEGWFLAKSEVATWPIIGVLARLSGVIFVNREDMASRVRCIYQLQNLAVSGGVCIFPEGTTTNRIFPERSNWAAGCFASVLKIEKPIIQAIGLTYENHDFHAWEGDSSFLSHLLKICGIKTHNVYLGSEQLVNKVEVKKVRLFAEFIRKMIKKECLENLAKSKTTFEESRVIESSQIAIYP
jgi:1-acyl-sn-glycerol-3-phosphate acyltransferase